MYIYSSTGADPGIFKGVWVWVVPLLLTLKIWSKIGGAVLAPPTHTEYGQLDKNSTIVGS